MTPDPGSGSEPQASDEELVAAANGGSAAAFEALYRRYAQWVLAAARRFLGRRDEAHDVVQETFLWLLAKFPGFQLRARMTTVLYPAVRHVALRLRERAERLAPLEQEPLAGPEEAGAPRTKLAAVLAGLPEAQREVLLLRFVDDLALAEIAAALQIPEGTVKSRLHHALAALRADPRSAKFFEDR